MTNKFPTSVSVEQLFGPHYIDKPPKKPEPTGIWRLVKAMMVALLLTIFVCVVSESGAYSIPVFAGGTLVFWVASMGKEKEE